jgi:hypothetical protein
VTGLNGPLAAPSDHAGPSAMPARPPRRSGESFGLLRTALVVALILGIPTFVILVAREPLVSWHPAARLEVHGDTWDGNLATDGDHIYLMTREEIAGFWGVLFVRSSGDGGRTWGEPVQVSAAGGPSAARHALTVGPDGSVWAAWSQQGAAPSTQRLILRRSRDGGRTWEAPIRASPPIVGLVGIPALVMTPEASLVAYTDGERGTVIVQELDADGAATTEPEALRSTTRELYDDAQFFDAGIAAAAVDGRMVVIANDGDGLWRSTAGDGQAWVQEAWYPVPGYAPPRLALVDGRMTALAAIPTSDGIIQITTETSPDGGRTWTPGATWLDRNAGEASLAVAAEHTAVLWESCDRFCSSPVIRLGDAEAWDGRASRIDGPAGRPAGTLLTADTMVVAWVEEGPNFEADERTVVVATGPRP